MNKLFQYNFITLTIKFAFGSWILKSETILVPVFYCCRARENDCIRNAYAYNTVDSLVFLCFFKLVRKKMSLFHSPWFVYYYNYTQLS